ncbi:hypothetical protein Y1Q_0000351 [Alligator mississippiensis]|uniref:Uncharacterized protein n=1 Tax=Alligator mississippiensis TaxID=8496 RepID=A0A151P0W2_ALLMI|nr:hypothetical protein Y1Q_0000351 [Alligator mississippiensis]
MGSFPSCCPAPTACSHALSKLMYSAKQEGGLAAPWAFQPKSHCSPKRPVRNSSPYWSMSRGDLARGYLLTCCFFLITRVYRRACLLDLGSKCGK